jgi:hypothetical protein
MSLNGIPRIAPVSAQRLGEVQLGRDAADVGLGGLLDDDQVSQVLAMASIQAL